MFIRKPVLLFICSVFLVCESGFLDTLERCKVTDGECQRALFQKVLSKIGKSGIPEFGIPPVDPFAVKNITVSVLDMINVTMVDGVAKGVKNCIVNKLETHVEKEHATLEMTCNITVKGHYKAYGDSPLIKNLLGGSTVRGEGKGRVAFENFRMKFDYHILIREAGGEQYIACQYQNLKYTYSIGKATFAATNLYLGKTEASDVIIAFLNQNWKFVMDTYGKPFLDKAMDIAYEQSHKFFDVVPTRYYLLEDFKPYIKIFE